MVASESAVGTLVLKEAISSQLNRFRPEIFPILMRKGFSEKKIQSMLKCGEEADIMIVKMCKRCNTHHAVKGTYHCNRRNCGYCSEKRRRRIVKEYLPYLKNYPSGDSRKHERLRFLTIAPPNYDDLATGMKDIYQKLAKFRRRKYILDRIYAGIWVLEATYGENGWNVHVHMIYYGKDLDNRIRGKCLHCNQNYIKFDKMSNNHYCANRKCNSTDVILYNNGDSKIVNEWKSCNNEPAAMYITNISTTRHMMNYLTKFIHYVSKRENNQMNFEAEAEFIMSTDKKKLINKFGEWYNKKVDKLPFNCGICGDEVTMLVHPTGYDNYVQHMNKKQPPGNWFQWQQHKDQVYLTKFISKEQAEKEALDFFDDLYMTENQLKNL